MNREEFNKELQAMQEECMAFGVEWRHEWPTYKPDTGEFKEAPWADFDIFVDRWQTVARIYRPFKPDANYEIYSGLFRRCISKLAAALVHS